MDALPILNEPTNGRSNITKHEAYLDIIDKIHNSTEKLLYSLLDHLLI